VSEINREYLLEQFRLMEEYLQRARGIARRSRDVFLADPIAILQEEIVQENLPDFEAFTAAVAQWLGRE